MAFCTKTNHTVPALESRAVHPLSPLLGSPLKSWSFPRLRLYHLAPSIYYYQTIPNLNCANCMFIHRLLRMWMYIILIASQCDGTVSCVEWKTILICNLLCLSPLVTLIVLIENTIEYNDDNRNKSVFILSDTQEK